MNVHGIPNQVSRNCQSENGAKDKAHGHTLKMRVREREKERAQGLAHTKKRVGEKVFQMKQGDRQDAWKGIGTGQAEERGVN